MLVRYATNFEDFKAAQRVVVRRTRRSLLLFLIFYGLMPVLGLAALLLLVWDMAIRGFLFPSWLGGLLFMTVWLGAYFPVARHFQLRRLYRAMKSGRDEAEPVELELTETEFISRIPGRSEGRFLPAAIAGFVEEEEIGLVYVTKNQFIMLPRRALNEEQWQTLRTWMREKRESMA